MANRWGNNGNSGRLYFLGLQNHCRWWLQPWNEKILDPWKKSYDHNSILKSRDITLPTNDHLFQAIVFPVVKYGCECWTIKKVEHQKIDAFDPWFWRRLLRVLWTARRSNQSFLKKINPEYSLERLMLILQYFSQLMRRVDSLEKTKLWLYRPLLAKWRLCFLKCCLGLS